MEGTYAADVSLSATVVGTTPEIVGYNVAHFMPGSNTESWWQYSEVNGARLWSSPNIVEPTDDNGIWGDGVTDQASFLALRSNLRSDPLNPTYINWSAFENNFENATTTGNIQRLNYALERLRANDISVLAMIGRTVSSYPFATQGTQAGYEDRWEHWQHYYAQAFHMARHYDVKRFQIYNEPNHSSQSNLSQAEYLERLQIASDAIHSAIEDVNQLYGKSLSAEVQGPVNSGGDKVLADPGGDPRDDLLGWGELIINNRHTDLFGNPDPNNDIFQTYAYHRYNQTGTAFGNTLADIKSDVNSVSGGEDIRFSISEFNVHSNSTFSTLPETLDSPSKIKTFGSIFSAVANNQPDELYVFKFGQTDDGEGGVKKNGTHYVDNDTAPYNTGGATKGAGVVRLFAKGFKDSKDLLEVPAVSGAGASGLRLAASHDEEGGKYYVFSTNVQGSSPIAVDFDLNTWNIQPGTMVTVEEVGERFHGEVSHLVSVPPSGVISLQQNASTTWLLTVPENGPRQQLVLDVVEDTMVSAGANSNTNYGTSPDLSVRNSSTESNARDVSFMKFDLGSVSTASIDQAILQVTAEDTLSSNGVVTHVYGIMDDSWDESTMTWFSAPNLANSFGTVDGIEDNFIEDVGTTAHFLGHLTSSATEEILRLDISDFLRDHGDQLVSLLVTREVRWDGENVEYGVGSLHMASKESADSTGPQLLLFVNETPLPADFNEDGTVDSVDLSLWESGYGISSDASRIDGDADGDGDVDGIDFLQWQREVDTAPAIVAAIHTVPEPHSALLPIGALVAFLLRHIPRSIESSL